MKHQNMKLMALLVATSIFSISTKAQKEGAFEAEMSKNFPNVLRAKEYFRAKADRDPASVSFTDQKHMARWLLFMEPRIAKDGTMRKYAEAIWGAPNTFRPTLCQDNEADWKPLGPITQIEKNKNGRGRLDAVNVRPNSTQDILIGSNAGGIWRTKDGGQTWKNTTDDLKITHLGGLSIVRNPLNPDRLVATTGFKTHLTTWGSAGILTSNNGGDSWQRAVFPVAAPNESVSSLYHLPVQSVVFHPLNNNALFALQDHNHIYASTDNGNTWSYFAGTTTAPAIPHFNTGIELYQLKTIAQNGETVLFASGKSKGKSTHTYRYQNGNWAAIPLLPPGKTKADEIDIEVCPSNPQIVYAFLKGVYPKVGNEKGNWLMKSTDGGNSFSSVGTVESEVWAIGVHPNNANKLYTYGLYSSDFKVSTDGGVTFTELGSNFHADTRTMQITTFNGNDIVYLGHDGGLTRYEESSGFVGDMPWGELSLTQFYGLSSSAQKADFIVGGTQDNGALRYDGTKWKKFEGGDGAGTYVSHFNPDNYWFGSNSISNGVGYYELKYKKGNNSNVVLNDFSGHWWEKLLTVVMEESPTQPHWLYHTWSKMDSTTNTKKSFVAKTNFNTATPAYNQKSPLFGTYVRALKVVSDDILICATSNYFKPDAQNPTDVSPESDEGLWITYNGGTDWHNITPPGTYRGEGAFIADIAVDFRTNLAPGQGIIAVSTTGYLDPYYNKHHVWLTTNGGDTWVGADQGLPDMPVTELEFQKGSANILYAATDLGVFYKRGAGYAPTQSWKCFSNGLPAIPIMGMDINYCKGKLRVATFGRGIYETELLEENPVFAQTVINTNTTWYGDKTITGHMRVASGASLTINNGTINFSRRATLHIEPGARVEVNNAELTNLCGQVWNGIRVHGRSSHIFPNATQYWWGLNGGAKQAGMLILNNATIRHAATAVSTWGENWYRSGGVVKAYNSKFIDNKRAVEIMAYENHFPPGHPNAGQVAPNECVFDRCQFLIETPVENYATPYFITMNAVRGVKVTHCKFEDLTAQTPRTTGIYTVDAGYNLTSTCLVPCNSHIPNQFTKLKDAVVNLAYLPEDRTISIDRAAFEGCEYGVVIDAKEHVSVTNSTFKSTNNWPTKIGIEVQAAAAFDIQENTFVKGGNQAFEQAIYVNNSGGHSNNLYKNTVQHTQKGIAAAGDNQDVQQEDKGLVFFCNRLRNETQNVAVLNGGNGIAQYVGTSAPLNPAGNAFNQLSVHNEHHLKNGAVGTHFFYTASPNANGLILRPNRNTPNRVTVINESEFNKCETLINKNVIIKGSGVKQIKRGVLSSISGKFEGNKGAYLSALSTYKNVVDGGNTPQVLNSLQQASNQDNWQLRTELLNKSPLSREALRDLVLENRLPNALLFEVLMQNADVVHHEELMHHLQEKSMPMPVYMIQALLGKTNERTIKRELEEQMTYHYKEARQAQKLLYEHYQNDSLGGDSALAWRSKWNDFREQNTEVGVLFEQGQYNAAKQKQAQLATSLVLTNAQQKVQDAQTLYLADAATVWAQRDSLWWDSQQVALITPHENDWQRVGHYARNLADWMLGRPYQHRIQASSSGKRSTQQAKQQIGEQHTAVKLYPNPASTHISVALNLLELGEAKKELRIYNITGNLVMQTVLSNEPVHNLELTDWPTGVYTWELVLAGERYQSGKINIVQP